MERNPLFSQLSPSSSSSPRRFLISPPPSPLSKIPEPLDILVEEEDQENAILIEVDDPDPEPMLIDKSEEAAEQQAQYLFSLCDNNRKGFIVPSDLVRVRRLVAAKTFALLERTFELGDHHHVNLVYERDFVRLIEVLLLEQHLPNEMQIAEISRFRTISLGHDREQSNPSTRVDSLGHHTPDPSSSVNLHDELSMTVDAVSEEIKQNGVIPGDHHHKIEMADQLIGSAQPTLQDPQTPDRIYKVVFVGDSAVGKTCFLHRFCHNRFKPLFTATIGVDFTVKTLMVRDRMVALQLWDTAGQERFRSITKQYFRKADGVVLMYDVTSETSFINVRNWIESIRIGVDNSSVICLVGNKVDLYPNELCRPITYQHGKELAEEFDLLFFESSAFTGHGIEETMQALALKLHQRENEQELIKLGATTEKRKRSWCCL